ncbi:hypothetical protein ETB97_011142 [Aspergillus alliaceus]|uniref:Uncharacterized protein n=1 Tax=Petromyces alliaceus TaxID=209559 RepID=A0A8H6A816_PETAA|nr:hypothetical protein ETB97_011142 [Aspergillus burnettii]
MRKPGDDGYRTPTIEDAEDYVSAQRDENSLYPSGIWEPQAHSSALESPHSSSYHKAEGDGITDVGRVLHRQNGPDNSTVVLSWKQRIRHFTWAYFTLTMATGGIANVLYTIPYRFRGLQTIGIIFFLFNIVLYATIWSLLAMRFYLYPYTFKASFLHPTESLFFPASVVSFGTILINVSQYGPDNTGPWLARAVEILFWIDACLAIIFSAGIYLLLWSTQTFTIAQMTPIWIFPAYPLLIIGPHAATFAIGHAFSCKPIQVVGCAMVIPLLLMYIFVCYMMIRAIVLRHILWPQKGEDKDEGGFEINQIKPESSGDHSPA